MWTPDQLTPVFAHSVALLFMYAVCTGTNFIHCCATRCSFVCGLAGQWREAMEIVQNYRETDGNGTPTANLYTTLMHVLLRCGRAEEAADVRLSMLYSK